MHIPDQQQTLRHTQQPPHLNLNMDQLQQMHKEQTAAAHQLNATEEAITAEQQRLDATKAQQQKLDAKMKPFDEGSTDESEAEWEAREVLREVNAEEKKEVAPTKLRVPRRRGVRGDTLSVIGKQHAASASTGGKGSS